MLAETSSKIHSQSASPKSDWWEHAARDLEVFVTSEVVKAAATKRPLTAILASKRLFVALGCRAAAAAAATALAQLLEIAGPHVA